MNIDLDSHIVADSKQQLQKELKSEFSKLKTFIGIGCELERHPVNPKQHRLVMPQGKQLRERGSFYSI